MREGDRIPVEEAKNNLTDRFRDRSRIVGWSHYGVDLQPWLASQPDCASCWWRSVDRRRIDFGCEFIRDVTQPRTNRTRRWSSSRLARGRNNDGI